jgi:4-amino-4-deoxy-L-arabinose transferase-like glycosyltransferase
MPPTTAPNVPRPPRFLSGPGDALRLDWRSAMVIVVYGTSLLLVNLGDNRVLTYHEVSFCQPAREMLANGDWIVPRIAGVPFLDKGPLTAWLIAAAMMLLGDNEFAVRLPGMISGILTAWMIASLAARWFGNRIGLVTGLMQLTVYSTLQLARLAECDTHLVAAVCGAMCSFALANVDSPRGRSSARWLPWSFYFCIGAAVLLKGPIGPVFILSGCLLFLLVNQELRGLRFFFNSVGLLILALMVIPHPLLVYRSYPPALEMWVLHNFGRFKGNLGSRPPLYYLYQVPLVLLPWFPLALLKVVRGVRQGLYVEPIWRFLGCWILPGMVLLCASSFKSKHYPAPLMPAATVAAALGLVELLQSRYRVRPRHHLWMAVAIVLGSAGAIGVVLQQSPEGAWGYAALIAIFAAGVLAMIEMERRRRFQLHLTAIFATVWLVVAGVFAWIMPHHDTYRDQTELARRINRTVPAGATVHLVELPESQITFYLDRPLVRRDRPKEFMAGLPADRASCYYVVAPERLSRALATAGEVTVLDHCDSIIRWMKPEDRLTCFRFESSPIKIAAQRGAARR